MPQNKPARHTAAQSDARKGELDLSTFEELFSPTSLVHLEIKIQRGADEISKEMLAAAIEANPNRPLPDAVRHRVCQELRGQRPKRKRGRPASRERRNAEDSAASLYPVILKAMRTDSRESGQKVRGLHQKVAIAVGKMVGLPALSVERLENIISARRSARKKQISSR